MAEDLARAVATSLDTPRPVLLPTVLNDTFDATCSGISDAQHAGVEVRLAYSIKTNPHRAALEAALSHGFLAEAISQLELDHAVAVGFHPLSVVLNGPGKWWPTRSKQRPVHTVFCDSLSELRRVATSMNSGCEVATTVGVRLRHPAVESRFGIELTPWHAYRDLTTALQGIPSSRLGVHFHLAPSILGSAQWWRLCRGFIEWARTLHETTGRQITTLDIGGGWEPREWSRSLLPNLPALVELAKKELPALEEMILEPGKALVQGAAVIVTRVLDVRAHGQMPEVVVDAAISDLPEALSYPHTILALEPDETWCHVGDGPGRICGRSCMEQDILATHIDTSTFKPGQLIAIADAGGYDSSMRYTFGRGEH